MEIEVLKLKYFFLYYEMFNGDKWIIFQYVNKKKFFNIIYIYKIEVLCDII